MARLQQFNLSPRGNRLLQRCRRAARAYLASLPGDPHRPEPDVYGEHLACNAKKSRQGGTR